MAGGRTPAWALALALCAPAGCQTPGRGGPPADPPVLRGRDGLLADTALQAVVERQVERDAPALLARLGDSRVPVRARAALALGSLQSTEAVPALVRALSDPSASVRRDAAFALGQAGVGSAARALETALSSEEDRAVRAEIFEALGKLGVPESLDALMAARVHPAEESIRALALSRLGAVGGVTSRESVEELVALLDAADPRTRERAAYFFGRAQSPAPWASAAEQLREALRRRGGDDPAAMYLAQGLGRLGDDRDADLLLDWAEHAEDWRTRANATVAVGGLPRLDPRSVDRLIERLDDPSDHVAIAAAQALAGHQRPEDAVRTIAAWVGARGDRWQVSEPLVGLLAAAGHHEAVLAWVDARDPVEPWAYAAALRALAALPGREAFERLTDAASSPSDRTADDAIRALGSRWRRERGDPLLKDDYVRAFSLALRRGEPRSAAIPAGVLADSVLGDAGLDALEGAYATWRAPDDVERMRTVLRVLGRSGNPRVERILLAVDDPELLDAASRAISELRGEEPDPTSATDEPSTLLASEARLDWGYLSGLGETPRLVLDTDRGRVVVRLDPEGAPQTVQTIARFAEQGRYDDVAFHRVVTNFVIQGGDFSRGDGSGGPGFSIRSELSETPYLRGTIGMASAGKDTEGSQFFITHSMQPHLDGGYTPFGWVVEGIDVVDRILVGDRILRAQIQRGH